MKKQAKRDRYKANRERRELVGSPQMASCKRCDGCGYKYDERVEDYMKGPERSTWVRRAKSGQLLHQCVQCLDTFHGECHALESGLPIPDFGKEFVCNRCTHATGAPAKAPHTECPSLGKFLKSARKLVSGTLDFVMEQLRLFQRRYTCTFEC